MSNRPLGAGKCEEFLEELERLPAGLPGKATAGDWRELLPQEAREHAASCANCEEALEDFAETRQALAGMAESLPEPGPWFVGRVMAKIRAQERELEEQANGVWIGVRRLAPRLAAFAAVLLVLGGTWALELRRAEQSRQLQPQGRPAVEGLFEAAPNAPLNDDIIASTHEEKQP
jgi:hypothetical protein